eukprot:g4902.t1
MAMGGSEDGGESELVEDPFAGESSDYDPDNDGGGRPVRRPGLPHARTRSPDPIDWAWLAIPLPPGWSMDTSTARGQGPWQGPDKGVSLAPGTLVLRHEAEIERGNELWPDGSPRSYSSRREFFVGFLQWDTELARKWIIDNGLQDLACVTYAVRVVEGARKASDEELQPNVARASPSASSAAALAAATEKSCAGGGSLKKGATSEQLAHSLPGDGRGKISANFEDGRAGDGDAHPQPHDNEQEAASQSAQHEDGGPFAGTGDPFTDANGPFDPLPGEAEAAPADDAATEADDPFDTNIDDAVSGMLLGDADVEAAPQSQNTTKKSTFHPATFPKNPLWSFNYLRGLSINTAVVISADPAARPKQGGLVRALACSCPRAAHIAGDCPLREAKLRPLEVAPEKKGSGLQIAVGEELAAGLGRPETAGTQDEEATAPKKIPIPFRQLSVHAVALRGPKCPLRTAKQILTHWGKRSIPHLFWKLLGCGYCVCKWVDQLPDECAAARAAVQTNAEDRKNGPTALPESTFDVVVAEIREDRTKANWQNFDVASFLLGTGPQCAGDGKPKHHGHYKKTGTTFEVLTHALEYLDEVKKAAEAEAEAEAEADPDAAAHSATGSQAKGSADLGVAMKSYEINVSCLALGRWSFWRWRAYDFDFRSCGLADRCFRCGCVASPTERNIFGEHFEGCSAAARYIGRRGHNAGGEFAKWALWRCRSSRRRRFYEVHRNRCGAGGADFYFRSVSENIHEHQGTAGGSWRAAACPKVENNQKATNSKSLPSTSTMAAAASSSSTSKVAGTDKHTEVDTTAKVDTKSKAGTKTKADTKPRAGAKLKVDAKAGGRGARPKADAFAKPNVDPLRDVPSSARGGDDMGSQLVVGTRSLLALEMVLTARVWSRGYPIGLTRS